EMDSETYGVSSDSPDGYDLDVKLAVQMDNSGNFVHSAPWSVDDQGKRNVSHGCINISPSNARWFYDNFGIGDPIVVTNSVGSYTQNDGGQDWQISIARWANTSLRMTARSFRSRMTSSRRSNTCVTAGWLR